MPILFDNDMLALVSNLDMRPTMAALVSYALFIVLMVRAGVTAAVDSYPRMNRFHHVFVLLFTLISFAFPLTNLSRLFAVFFLYSFHRLYFLFFFGIARRSFSLNLLVAMARRGSPMSARELADAYADGRGLASLSQSRMTALLREGLLQTDGSGNICLTTKGRIMVRIRNSLLWMFNLKSSGGA